LLTETGLKPDAVLLSQERFTAHEKISQGSVVVDGSENASVQFPACCRPIPGDAIVGYLGRGEGLVIHTDQCAVGQRLKHKDSERFIAVEWADEPARSFEVGLVVTIANGKGVLARVAQAITSAEADITMVNMADEISGHEAADLRFVCLVRDLNHLNAILGSLRRVPSVLQAQRTMSGVGREA
jgi:GTP pyrophosphokinase